jgi:hypothetical protein
VAVVSVHGSPGTTTVARTLAAALGRPDRPCLLVEADPDGGVLAARHELRLQPSLTELVGRSGNRGSSRRPRGVRGVGGGGRAAQRGVGDSPRPCRDRCRAVAPRVASGGARGQRRHRDRGGPSPTGPGDARPASAGPGGGDRRRPRRGRPLFGASGHRGDRTRGARGGARRGGTGCAWSPWPTMVTARPSRIVESGDGVVGPPTVCARRNGSP